MSAVSETPRPSVKMQPHPETPPPTAKSAYRTLESDEDSGVEDISRLSFEDPGVKVSEDETLGNSVSSSSPKSLQSDTLKVEDDDHNDGDSTTTTPSEPVPHGTILSENPFENEQSKILFEAIDRLQSLGTDQYLDIPQLVIVGGQSCGKSSLLQTLTDIPFPTGSGCCTRFPIRIVSRRTRPGTKNSYQISIEEPSVKVSGLKSAPEQAMKFHESGENLSVDEFQDIMDKVAYEQMGIRKGRGADRINFVGNVLKVELSGPNRSHFSIVDLPGIYGSDHDTNTEEMRAIKKMVVQYMRMPENIVICVVEALCDVSMQGIFALSIKEVQKERLVGVFTKCDVASDRDRIISLSAGKNLEDTDLNMHNGWFVVWNRRPNHATNQNGPQNEDELFGSDPWNAINEQRRGSKALKAYLANVLSSRIRNAFPKLIASMSSQLEACVVEASDLGSMRDTLPAQQQFLMATVHKFQDQVNLALNRPGHFGDTNKELRKTVKDLNGEYDAFMRHFGHCWEFEDADKDPKDELVAQFLSSREEESRIRAKRVVKDEEGIQRLSMLYGNQTDIINGRLSQEIEAKLPRFQANQLPGVVNPDIYPAMFQEQTQKWNVIAQLHLNRIADSVWTCVEAILAEVCPPTNDTLILNDGLRTLLRKKFDHTCNATRQRLQDYCKREERPELLQTTDPRFADSLEACRQLRFYKASMALEEARKMENDHIGVKIFLMSFQLIHSSTAQNMINDVHDILKIYYNLALESFIRHVTSTIIEEFVSSTDGPLVGLNTKLILGLSEEETQCLAMEDEQTVRRREALTRKIEKLTVARDLAETARAKTR